MATINYYQAVIDTGNPEPEDFIEIVVTRDDDGHIWIGCHTVAEEEPATIPEDAMPQVVDFVVACLKSLVKTDQRHE